MSRKPKIQFEVKDQNHRGVDYTTIYAEFSHIEPPPLGECKTKKLCAELYKVGDVIVWMDPFSRGIPLHVFKTDNMDNAVEQTKEMISKRVTKNHSLV